MARIFISYRRDDSAYVAAMLAQRLRAAFGPDSVYIDIDAIPLGIDFRQHIQNAVHKCDVLLALVGQRWLSVAPDSGRRRIDDPADFVRIEIEAAIRRDIPVVPGFSWRPTCANSTHPRFRPLRPRLALRRYCRTALHRQSR